MAVEKKKREFNLDIFSVLRSLDRKDYQVWENLSDAERKEFSPYVTMMWMSGADDDLQKILLNTFVNQIVFSLGNHPALLTKLLAVSSSGKSKRYVWKKRAKSKSESKGKTITKVVSEYYGIPTRHVPMYMKNLADSDVIEMAEELGLEASEIKDLKKELKK